MLHPWLLELSGGAITLSSGGNVLVGVGSAEGRIVQTGGVFSYKASISWVKAPIKLQGVMAVGAGGGEGRYDLEGGEFTSINNVFVGGFTLEDYTNNVGYAETPYTFTGAGFPYGAAGSKGVLRVDGGSFTTTRDVTLSREGEGTVEFGAAGSFSARALCLTNGTARLRFVFGAAGTTLEPSVQTLAVGENARIEVDLSDYVGNGTTFELLTCGEMRGRVPQENITVTGARCAARVLQADDGLTLLLNRGTMLIFR